MKRFNFDLFDLVVSVFFFIACTAVSLMLVVNSFTTPDYWDVPSSFLWAERIIGFIGLMFFPAYIAVQLTNVKEIEEEEW